MKNLDMMTLLALLPIGFIVSSCGEGKQTSADIPEYRTTVLDTTTAVVYTEYSTIIQSNSVVEIRPKVSGYLSRISRMEGTKVKKGDLIFKIDDADYRQQVNAAEAAMQSAKAAESNASLEVTKLTPLVQKGIISPYELETAKSNLTAASAQYKQAKAQYENACITLGYTEIKSPVNGVLGRIYVREGSLISPSMGEALTTVSSEGDVSAYFSFDEKNLAPERRKTLISGRYKPDERDIVELQLPDGSIYEHKGRLESASGIIDRNTGSIELKVIFPNSGYDILTGSSGVLRFPFTYNGVIVVPQTATYELQDKKMVFIVQEDNTVTRKTITVEGVSGNDYVVTNLPSGTKIVTEGVDKLKEGMKISPKEI